MLQVLVSVFLVVCGKCGFNAWEHNPRLKTTDATCVALPTNQPIHPPRNDGNLMRVDNQEQPFHPIYNYAVITDSVEGLILTNLNIATT